MKTAFSSEYQICTRCVMDTSDPNITFDDRGVCNHCRNFDRSIAPIWCLRGEDNVAIDALRAKILSSNHDGDFDCIIGLSGGLDSSFAAYNAVERFGLRPLLFHVDAGWNTDRAVGNIEKLVDGLGLDLYTEVVNWQSVRRMQLAFESGYTRSRLSPRCCIFLCLYRFARKNKTCFDRFKFFY